MAATVTTPHELLPVPAEFDKFDVEQFLYREARYADENDYDPWEALWTDDALYWVPANGADTEPARQMSIICDNRSRIGTRLKQIRTGKRYAQAPPSNMRRLLSPTSNSSAAEPIPPVASTSRSVRTSCCSNRVPEGRICGAVGPPTGCAAPTTDSGWSTRRSSSSTTTGRCPPSAS